MQIAPLRRQLKGAKARCEPCPHTALLGISGVGKTLLAKALSIEYGSALVRSLGGASSGEIAANLRNLKHGDMLFIDEAHELDRKVQELLYIAIDDHRTLRGDTLVKDQTEGMEMFEIAPFTLLLATDQPGRLLNPLLKRIEVTVSLDFYSLREMKEIVATLSTSLNILLSPQAQTAIARASGGIPRVAKHLLGNLRRHFEDAESRQISSGQVYGFLKLFGVDKHGLDRNAGKYLDFLRREGKASIEALSLWLGFDVDYVRRQIEPQLRHQHLITIGGGGRRLTEQGKQRLQECSEQSTKPLQRGGNLT
jgi:Holliday junction DNA helicase RuvB